MTHNRTTKYLQEVEKVNTKDIGNQDTEDSKGLKERKKDSYDTEIGRRRKDDGVFVLGGRGRVRLGWTRDWEVGYHYG